jgi:hypothetical protein
MTLKFTYRIATGEHFTTHFRNIDNYYESDGCLNIRFKDSYSYSIPLSYCVYHEEIKEEVKVDNKTNEIPKPPSKEELEEFEHISKVFDIDGWKIMR